MIEPQGVEDTCRVYRNWAPTFPIMLPTSCKQDKNCHQTGTVAPGLAPCPPASRGSLEDSLLPSLPAQNQGPCLLCHWPAPTLTFPCISIRSVRVMLSSGSSSSPASEPLILSGGAGATAAWESVHAAAWLALQGQQQRGKWGREWPLSSDCHPQQM